MSNANTKNDFSPIPDGDYAVRLIQCLDQATKNGAGRQLVSRFQIFKGDFKNRILFENFLYEHTNEKAAEIGNRRLSDFLKAVGVSGGVEGIGNDLTRVEEYLEMPLVVSLATEAAGTYIDKSTGQERVSKPRNKITSFKTL